MTIFLKKKKRDNEETPQNQQNMRLPYVCSNKMVQFR